MKKLKKMVRDRLSKYWKNNNKYQPHQGAQEKERRIERFEKIGRKVFDF